MTRCTRFCILLLTLCLAPSLARGASTPVTVLYTTDTHGYIEPGPNTIGLGTIAAIRKSIPGSILLDAGDFLFGAPLTLIDKGKSVLALMRQAGYTAAAIGNHEFSQGREAFYERNRESMEGPNPLPMLSANILGADGAPLFQPWTRAMVGDVSLCVFGLTTPLTRTLASSYDAASLTIADPLTTGAAMAATLRASGCDIVLALTHLGSTDNLPATSLALAANTPGLDAVIDGHSHRRFARLEPGATPVVSSGAHGKAIGKLVFTVDTRTGKILGVENTFLRPKDVAAIPPDPALAKAVSDFSEAVNREFASVVATSPTPLAADRPLMRTRELPLGSLAADALRAAHGDDIAIINGGAIREGLPAGNITRKDILWAFPFNNRVVSLSVTGRELLAILERGFARLPAENGGFPQISGFSVVVDASAPKGKRVRSVLVNGKPLDNDMRYTLATNDYMAQGGGGNAFLAAKTPLRKERFFDKAFVDYLDKNGFSSLTGEPRITIHNLPPQPAGK